MGRLALILTILTTVASAASGQPSPPQTTPREADQQASTPSSSHIDGTLRRMIKDFRGRQAADQRATPSRVAVTIRFRSSDNATIHRSILAAVGAAPANDYRNVVESYVSIDAIETLAANPEIAAIDWIVPPQPQVIGQGVAVHNASSWHASGRQGTGVRVGIVDVGFIGLTSLLGSELPPGVTARCYTSLGVYTSSLSACETGTVHGTAVAEAVVDMAPGVQLYIANPASTLDLRNTVLWMASEGVRVINHSVGWTWSGPGDGTTPFADSPLSAVNDAVARGIVWTNAAGNSALSTWSGTYRDANGNNWIEFANVSLGAELNGVNLGAGQQIVAQSRWEDSWTAAARDLDLYLMDPFGNIVAWSEGDQNGAPGATPRELLVYTAQAAGTYYLAVHRFAGTAPAWVDVQSFIGPSLQYPTAAHSIANPAESANPGALAVGAVPWSNTSAIEPFSSRGPTRDGRMKPDLVAVDRADSVTYGPGGFAGTSQAAPHVAGLAALVVEAFPTVEPQLIARYLRTIAQPRGAPDDAFGVGLAQVPTFPTTISLSAVLTTPSGTVAGQSISFTAFAIGGQAPFEYKFWIYSAATGWTVLQDYSQSNVAVWTPSAAGTYPAQVWVRRVGSSAAYEDWRNVAPVDVSAPPPISVTSFSASSTFPAPVKATIVWTVQASGGAQPLQYQFWRYREGAGWTMVRDYGTQATFIWTPQPAEAGTYRMQVFVRSAGSTAVYDAWAGTAAFEIFIPPVVVTSLPSSVSFPVTVGTPIMWVAIASGGTSPLQYQFWRFKQGTGWTMAQDYSSSAVFQWTPGIGDAGTYAIQVWVRQVGSTAPYEAWRGSDYFTINPAPSVALTSFTQTPTSPSTAGVPITWTAMATGGATSIQYKFLIFSSGAWTVLQDYSTVSTVTWTPATAGTYAGQVWVRSLGSSAAYEDWRGTGLFTIAASPVVFITDLSANVSLPTVTHPITWTATAGGGSTPLSYQFWRYREGGGWSLVQDYSSNSSYTWTPALGEDGTYSIQVWVRAAGSTAPYDQWRGTGFFKILPPTVLYMTSMAGDYIGGGTTRLFTPADGNFLATRNFDNGVSISALSPPGPWWYLDFAAAGDAQLMPGVYGYATRFPFQLSSDAALSIYGEGRGCNEVVARFVIWEATYASDGTPSAFAADFEQHCEGVAAAVYGSIRINSTAPIVSVRPLTFSGGPSAPVGVPLTWRAGSGTGREYRAWLYQASTRTWRLLHEYSTEPTVTWTPQAGDEGDWVVVMWERATGTTVNYDTWRVSEVVKVQ